MYIVYTVISAVIQIHLVINSIVIYDMYILFFEYNIISEVKCYMSDNSICMFSLFHRYFENFPKVYV